MKQRKKLIIAFVIIGIILIFSVIRSVYIIYKVNRGYEATDAICIGEYENYRS